MPGALAPARQKQYNTAMRDRSRVASRRRSYSARENSASRDTLPFPMPENAPRIALVGRPNVGKSTLFNRLIRSKRAITHDRPGITRDCMEGLVRGNSHAPFVLIDTGGLTLDANNALAEGPESLRGFEAAILSQTAWAMRNAVGICLVVDGREGLTPCDEHVAAYVRKAGKPAIVAVNKVDGPDQAATRSAEFYALGLPLLPCSAEHGFNVRALEDELRLLLPPEAAAMAPEQAAQTDGFLRLALLGRPNAGKSSLVNALVGAERMVVSDIAGTTRDSVDVSADIDGVPCTFVDTAGVRRPSRVADTVERHSVNSSLKSTTKAHITLLVADGPGGMAQQDKRLIDLLSERKTPFMLLINKCDVMGAAEARAMEQACREMLAFCPHVPLLFVSALSGKNLKKIVPLALKIRGEYSKRAGTGELNRVLAGILGRHQPPLVKGARAKFYYLTQAEINPPTFVFFVNDENRVTDSYARYLEKALRKELGFAYSPVRVRFRSAHGGRKKQQAVS